jgi:hypothetical protein
MGEGESGTPDVPQDRRTGEDRRKGDRRGGGTRHSMSLTDSRGHQLGFLDRPWLVAGAVGAGLLLGVGVMTLSDSSRLHRLLHPSVEIEMGTANQVDATGK